MLIIKELTRYRASITPTNEDGSIAVPINITYRVDAVEAGVQVIGNTTVNVTESPYILTVPAAMNRCKKPVSEVETFRITVTTEGLASEEHLYRVQRMKGLV